MAHKSTCTCPVCTGSQPPPRATLDLDGAMMHEPSTTQETAPEYTAAQVEMMNFMKLLQEFEQATMKRLVAVSQMQNDRSETSKVLFQQADAKHQEAAHAVLNAYRALLDVIENEKVDRFVPYQKDGEIH